LIGSKNLSHLVLDFFWSAKLEPCHFFDDFGIEFAKPDWLARRQMIIWCAFVPFGHPGMICYF